MAINKVEFAGNTLIDLTPTTAEAEDVAEDKVFLDRSGTLTQGTLVRGASDYETLSNKPSINNIELIGNKTTSDLGINTPTKVSDLTNDAGYITSYTETDPIFTSSVAHSITSTDITNWNNKSEFSGSYNDLTNKPNIPDSLSDLSDDSTHRVVTDTEKTTWNNKSNFSGNYNDLTNKPTLFSGDYDDLTNKPTIPVVPTNISSFTNDSGYITGLVTLEYGTSTWQDFLDAYNSNKVVYCKVTSQYGERMAFFAYKSASNVEFQYYRSLSSPSVSSQPDEVYVYALTSANKWTTTTRKASSTIAVETGLSRSYTANTRTITLSVDTSTIATKQYVDDTLGDIETLLGGI